MKQKLYAVVLGIFFQLAIFFSCSKINVQSERIHPKCALLAIVESADNTDGLYLMMQEYTGDSAIPMLCKLLSIDTAQVAGLTFNEIVDSFGEPAVINDIRSAAISGYDSIIILTDSMATFANMKANIETLSGKYSLDMIVDLHGDSIGLLFYDGFYWNDEIRDSISSLAQIRAIYQTGCYGAFLIDDWSVHSVCVCSGPIGDNSLTRYSPKLFLQNWINGDSFQVCVDKAYLAESDSLRSFLRSNGIPFGVEGMLLSGSQQIVNGNAQASFFTACSDSARD